MRSLTDQQLSTIMNDFVAECKDLFGDNLSDVRLFGSYARGDYNSQSDIDIMIVLDMSLDKVRKSLDGVCKIASELDLKYNVNISPVLKSKQEYDLRKHSYGFCRNVEIEGVSRHVG